MDTDIYSHCYLYVNIKVWNPKKKKTRRENTKKLGDFTKKIPLDLMKLECLITQKETSVHKNKDLFGDIAACFIFNL